MIQVGIDEVGRGAWAGPLIFAAIAFLMPVDKKDFRNIAIRDSKLLTASQRELAAIIIKKYAHIELDCISHNAIDRIGLKSALAQCIKRLSKKIIKRLGDSNEVKFWIDGRRVCALPYNHEYIIKGDMIMPIISCASIVAKVERDAHMRSIALKFPEYGFEHHVGYGTKEHQTALKKYGPCEIHRKSYAPIKALL